MIIEEDMADHLPKEDPSKGGKCKNTNAHKYTKQATFQVKTAQSL